MPDLVIAAHILMMLLLLDVVVMSQKVGELHESDYCTVVMPSVNELVLILSIMSVEAPMPLRNVVTSVPLPLVFIKLRVIMHWDLIKPMLC